MKLKKIFRSSFPLIIFAFIFASVFAFLKLSDIKPSSAVSLDNFNPGNIITDYVMSKYDSMTEREIQAFLDKKGNCDDTRTYLADYYTKVSYHIKDGHFVCLAEETFGDGTDYGEDAKDGDSAAHIIYEAAQDYKINPQVLIVLLQKEQGLITDSWPNSVQYRSATGYGCPDTAACSTKYYGFKNQVRNAAKLFRSVLDGGWTNYPLGNNYIQYNPSSSCGGSTVYIENLATSSLYRYTPYQPNASALAAGYGTGNSCGAYGNRNFYLYFNDWFGDSTSTGYEEMVSPRYMTNIETEEIDYYIVKRMSNEGLCLSSNKNSLACVLYSNLKNTEWDWKDMETPRYLSGNEKTRLINLSEKSVLKLKDDSIIYYNKKITLPDGKQCLLPEDQNTEKLWCATFNTLDEVKFKEESMDFPRLMKASEETFFMDPVTKKVTEKISEGEEIEFTKKIKLPDGNVCLISSEYGGCAIFKEFEETWMPMRNVRQMMVKNGTYKTNSSSGSYDKTVYMNKGMIRKYVTKIYYGGAWCLRTEYDHNLDTDNCVLDYELSEV